MGRRVCCFTIGAVPHCLIFVVGDIISLLEKLLMLLLPGLLGAHCHLLVHLSNRHELCTYISKPYKAVLCAYNRDGISYVLSISSRAP